MNEIENMLNSPDIVCKCGCRTFVSCNMLKRVSKLISPTGRDEIVPIPLFACSKCGDIPDEIKNSESGKLLFKDEPKIKLN